LKPTTKPQTTHFSIDKLDFGIKSKSKRKRVLTLLVFLLQHEGSYVSKRRMVKLLGINERSLFRYLRTLHAFFPLEKRYGMYGLVQTAF
jgi:predicted DNA-binding transcriptional regulator YafY